MGKLVQDEEATTAVETQGEPYIDQCHSAIDLMFGVGIDRTMNSEAKCQP